MLRRRLGQDFEEGPLVREIRFGSRVAQVKSVGLSELLRAPGPALLPIKFGEARDPLPVVARVQRTARRVFQRV